MFRTHTPIKDNKTGNRWFVVNSFSDFTVLSRYPLLQSINTTSELKTINKEQKNDARGVSEGFGELITDFKFSSKSNHSNNNSISEEKVEVVNKRYNLRELQKK